MSILKSLQTYLTDYKGMELKPMKEIATDIVGDIGEYALAPTGNGPARRDVLGNLTYQNNYMLYAKEHAASEIDREEVHDFLEDFSEWLEEREEAGNLPALPGAYRAQSLEASNAMMLDIDENGMAIYQVQLHLTIRKEKQNG